ncbi:682_t:CDS:2 [Paraglomus occultum]|uniref:682_t:CDS:1 n=1 Tax=Paraglomus occultum TaxID=144539 RepID=A0A9N9F9C3_9GLOM|nr:682_t:CDS:2 [Paraglomus occultum]
MADHPTQCVLQSEDYLECLHNTKELARARRIRAEILKKSGVRKKKEATLRKTNQSALDSKVMRLGIITDKND